jgi:hypothetical protein
MVIQKALITGTPDEIRKNLENLSRGLAPHEYSAGERLRALVVELAKYADIKMWLLTYHDESQELEVTLSGDPHCDAIIIDRDKLGFNCHVTWERWLGIKDAAGTEKAAGLIADILKLCARGNGTQEEK